MEQGYIFTGVCHSVNVGGGLSACWYNPLATDTPPWQQTHPPQEQTPPEEQTPPWEQTPPRSRHPPGADPPGAEHAGRYGQRAGGTHPTGMQSSFHCMNM